MTRRLGAALVLDLRLQWRFGFLYGVAFVVLFWVVLLRQLPPDVQAWALPLAIYLDLAAAGYYFLAAIVLLEKEDGVLSALAVTPLRLGEYLASKFATLTAVSLVVTLLVTVGTVGLAFQPLLLAVAVIQPSLLVLSLGLVALARYDTISSFLVPSQLYLVPALVPLLGLVAWVPAWVPYLVPFQGSLLMIQGAFGVALEPWQLVYAVVWQAVATVLLTWYGVRQWRRHVIQGGA